MNNSHHLPAQEVLDAVSSNTQGLNHAEAVQPFTATRLHERASSVLAFFCSPQSR